MVAPRTNDEQLQAALDRAIVDMQVITQVVNSGSLRLEAAIWGMDVARMDQSTVDTMTTEIETAQQSLDYWSELIRRFKSIQETGKY